MSHVDGGDEVADVNRVERPAKDADANGQVPANRATTGAKGSTSPPWSTQ